MLVLTRNNSESIFIDGGIEVILLQSRNGRARIGIRAPKDCHVVRSELIGTEPKKGTRSVKEVAS